MEHFITVDFETHDEVKTRSTITWLLDKLCFYIEVWELKSMFFYLMRPVGNLRMLKTYIKIEIPSIDCVFWVLFNCKFSSLVIPAVSTDYIRIIIEVSFKATGIAPFISSYNQHLSRFDFCLYIKSFVFISVQLSWCSFWFFFSLLIVLYALQFSFFHSCKWCRLMKNQRLEQTPPYY